MRVAFGEFRFDGKARRLERRGDEVHLTPKAFRLLEILLEERPKAVAKEALTGRLWPDVIVDEGNLTNLIAEICGAIASAGGDPELIRTARRFGYAFDGEAFPVERAAPARPSAPLVYLATADARIYLREGTHVLGRDLECAVAIASPAVSRRHAQIVVSGGIAVVEDLGSRNGTFVGATRVNVPVELRANDRILLGSVLAGTIEIVAAPESTVSDGLDTR